MSIRRLLPSLLLACVLTAVACQSAPNDVILGERKSGDELLAREFVQVPSKLLRRVKHRFSFHGGDATIVSQVRFLDQNKKGNGATAKLMKGGPEFNYVVVDFASVRGHSVDFIVEIYGTKDGAHSGEWLRNEMPCQDG